MEPFEITYYSLTADHAAKAPPADRNPLIAPVARVFRPPVAEAERSLHGGGAFPCLTGAARRGKGKRIKNLAITGHFNPVNGYPTLSANPTETAISMRSDPTSETIEHTHRHLHVGFAFPRPVLSSAVLNGGRVSADHILNLRVVKNRDGTRGPFEPSTVTLERYGREKGWKGTLVGMMTAADAESFRRVERQAQGVSVTALVTAGISNARRAGERAECRDMSMAAPESGTINIILLTDARLTEAAMVEAVLMVTEAKTAALQNLGVTNPVSGAQATGTGTDAVAIVSGTGPVTVGYCGKHMLFGEMLATAVMDAVTASLAAKVQEAAQKRPLMPTSRT